MLGSPFWQHRETLQSRILVLGSEGRGLNQRAGSWADGCPQEQLRALGLVGSLWLPPYGRCGLAQEMD